MSSGPVLDFLGWRRAVLDFLGMRGGMAPECRPRRSP
jgi:hypothetical protein